MPDAADEFKRPEDPKALITWLEKKRLASKSVVPEQQLRQNLSFMLNQQWIVWDPKNGRYNKATARPTDTRNAPVRITANKIAGLVERSVAKLTKDAPVPEARPVTDDDTDIDAAKVSTRILNHELYRLDWDTQLTEFYFWPAVLGWSYDMVWWDPKAGDHVATDDKGSLFAGEVMIEEVPAFELNVDPNSRRSDLTDAKHATRTTSMTREAAWERYGKVPVEADPGRSLSDEVHGMTGSSDSKPGDSIKVHQFWQRPGSRSNPEGMVVTYSGKTILEGPTPYPYDHGRLPFVQANLLPGIGTREGRTWVTDLIPLQTDYNDARSREATIRRELTPKVLAPEGAIDPRRVTSRVEVISYAPTGDKPTMMIPDSGWMAQFEAGMSRADAEMGDRAGQQDVSAGKAPTASMPAAAILALQEADDTRLATSNKELKRFIKEVGWHVLQLAKQFWSEERIVRTWSEDGDLEVTKFTGADVAKALDIHISSESSLTRSKAARAQMTMDLVDRQIITDPRTIIRMLDIPGTDFLSEALNRQARKAHRENGELLKGVNVAVAPFDVHAVHIEEHVAEMLEKWYDEADPHDPRRVAFDTHLAVHQELMAAPPMTAPPGGAPAPGAPGAAPGGAPNPNDPQAIRQAAGIGGPGNPGQVPGIPPEVQAAHQPQAP